MGTRYDLNDIDPEEAVQLYKQDRQGEVSEATLQSHGYRLKHFLNWCDENDINSTADLDGLMLQKFKIWRKGHGIQPATLKSTLDTLRVFLRFCESVDAAVDGLAESVNSPSLSPEDAIGTDILPSERAKEILSYLYKFEYASVRHAVLRVLWATGMRIGGAHAIDLQDCHLKHSKNAHISLKNRPEQGTRLKNGDRGERDVSLDERTAIVLSDYIEQNRWEVTDDEGRNPLFTSRHGRLTRNTFRAYCYRLTRPCELGKECPHDRERETCEAVESRMSASKCPDSVGAHAVRRGAITHYCSEGVAGEVVSDRMNVSKKVLDEHYDFRSEREKMEQRREHVDRVDLD